jgi:hypothetical protein
LESNSVTWAYYIKVPGVAEALVRCGVYRSDMSVHHDEFVVDGTVIVSGEERSVKYVLQI